MVNRDQLVTLIQTSPLLTEAERKYWSDNLPSMSDPHAERLEKILSSSNDIPFLKQVEEYVVALAKSATAAMEALPAKNA